MYVISGVYNLVPICFTLILICSMDFMQLMSALDTQTKSQGGREFVNLHYKTAQDLTKPFSEFLDDLQRGAVPKFPTLVKLSESNPFTLTNRLYEGKTVRYLEIEGTNQEGKTRFVSLPLSEECVLDDSTKLKDLRVVVKVDKEGNQSYKLTSQTNGTALNLE